MRVYVAEMESIIRDASDVSINVRNSSWWRMQKRHAITPRATLRQVINGQGSLKRQKANMCSPARACPEPVRVLWKRTLSFRMLGECAILPSLYGHIGVKRREHLAQHLAPHRATLL